MVAARIATLKQGARADLSPIGERSQQEAADLLNVGKRSVERARKLLDRRNRRARADRRAPRVGVMSSGKMSVGQRTFYCRL
jgi:hypothetical protein